MNDFHKAQWDAMVLPESDLRFAIPKHLWLGILIYDRDAFEEAGVKLPDKNWGREAYQAALTRLTRKGAGGPDRWGGYIPGTSYDRVYTHVLGDGGHMVDEKDKGKPRFAEPAALGAFDWIRARTWDQNVLIQRGQYDREDSYTLLSQGRVAMIEEGTSFMYWLAENVKRRWDIMHLPQGRQVPRGAPLLQRLLRLHRGGAAGVEGRRLVADALPGRAGVPADDAAGQVAGHRPRPQVRPAGVREDDALPRRAPGRRCAWS